MGPQGVDWASIALSVGDQIAGATAAERPALTAVLAKQHGLSPHYFRRILALRTLLLDERFAGLALRLLPLSAAEIIKRWAEHDASEARKAAIDTLSGGLDTTELAKQEQESRGSKSITSGRSSASRRFRDRLRNWAVSKYNGHATLLKPGPGFEAVLKFRRDNGGKVEHIAFVSIGDYSDPTLEKKRAREVLLQALGLRHFIEEVTLVCSSESSRDIALDFLEEHRIESSLVSVCTEKELFKDWCDNF